MKRVVGIGYEAGDPAPTVVLKGAGAEAEAILDQARSRGDVAIVHDAALLSELYRVPVDGPIDRDLFPIMATLLAHVLDIDRRNEGNVHD